jgi:hypothetical protein
MDTIDRTFARLLGLACWGVHWEPVTGLSFSFGAPRMTVREAFVPTRATLPRVLRLSGYRNITVKGTWWFWTWCGEWQLRLADDDRPITSLSATGRRREALRLLDGQRLLTVGVDSADGCTEMLFDLGAALRILGDTDDLDNGIWSLYKPGGRVLVVRSDGCYSNEKGTAPHRWRPRR